MIALPCALALACDGTSAAPGGARTDAGKTARVKVRTVSVEVLPVVEQTMTTGADARPFSADPPMPIAGVEVCPWKARPLRGTLSEFVDLDLPCKDTDDTGAVPPFDGLPTNSELVFRYNKSGFVSATSTQVTSDEGVVVPNLWRRTVGYGVLTVMQRDGALDGWLQADPAAMLGNGLLAILTIMLREGTGGMVVQSSGPLAGSTFQVPGVFDYALGVKVTLQSPSTDVGAQLTTLADRPSYLTLPAAEYVATFAHPRVHCEPRVQLWDFYPFGYPGDELDTMRIPVFGGYLAMLSANCVCVYDPPEGGPSPLDLSTCSVPGPGGN